MGRYINPLVSPHRTVGDALLTPKEVLGILQVGERQLRRWRASGKLPAIKLGPLTVRYRKSDVERILKHGFGSSDRTAV